MLGGEKERVAGKRVKKRDLVSFINRKQGCGNVYAKSQGRCEKEPVAVSPSTEQKRRGLEKKI